MGTVVLVLVAMTGGPTLTGGWINTVPWLGRAGLQQPQQPQQQQQVEMRMMSTRMEPPTTAPLSISFILYHKARIPEPEEDNTRSALIRHKKWVRGRWGKNLPLLAPYPSSIFNSCLPPIPPPPTSNNRHCRLMMTIARICFYFLLPSVSFRTRFLRRIAITSSPGLPLSTPLIVHGTIPYSLWLPPLALPGPQWTPVLLPFKSTRPFTRFPCPFTE